MNIKEKLLESTISNLYKLQESTYYSVLCTNRGMWGGMQTPMRLEDKVILFTNREACSEYLDRINDEKSVVNNFNSYGIDEVEVDENQLDKYAVFNSVEELDKASNDIQNARQNKENTIKNERDNLMIILDKELTDYLNTVSLEESTYCDIIICIYKNEIDEYEYTHQKVTVKLDNDKFKYIYTTSSQYSGTDYEDINELVSVIKRQLDKYRKQFNQ